MDVESVLAILDALKAAGVRCWVGGGWGIDALVHHQTRPHEDLDLAVRDEDMLGALDALAQFGYSPTVDRRPVRLVLRDDSGREVDLHPVHFDENDDGLQANIEPLPAFRYPAGDLTTGTIGGRTVPCISVALQIEFHSGYEPTDRDREDLRLLESAQPR